MIVGHGSEHAAGLHIKEATLTISAPVIEQEKQDDG